MTYIEQPVTGLGNVTKFGHPLGRYLDVYLNGEKLMMCAEANDIEGVARIYHFSTDGRPVVDSDGEPTVVEVYGDVAFMFRGPQEVLEKGRSDAVLTD